MDITFTLYTGDGIEVVEDVKRSSNVYRYGRCEFGKLVSNILVVFAIVLNPYQNLSLQDVFW